jgi:hypothetical protein
MRCPAAVTGRSSLSTTKRSGAARQFKRTASTPLTPGGAINPLVVEAEAAGPAITITFDRPVFLSDTPTGWRSNLALTEIGAAKTASNIVVITYSGAQDAATTLFAPTGGNNGIRGADNGIAIIPSTAISGG